MDGFHSFARFVSAIRIPSDTNTSDINKPFLVVTKMEKYNWTALAKKRGKCVKCLASMVNPIPVR